MAAEATGLQIVDRPGGIELLVKVVPGASRTRIAGQLGNALKVAVAAPPEGGQANRALVALLAELLGVRKADVQIISGHSQPLKRVAIAGVSAATARQRLI